MSSILIEIDEYTLRNIDKVREILEKKTGYNQLGRDISGTISLMTDHFIRDNEKEISKKGVRGNSNDKR